MASAEHKTNLALDQEAIRAKCFHPTGAFIEFSKEEIEQSIPERFEKIVRLYPDRVAVKTRSQQLSYNDLNRAANRLARAILAISEHDQEPLALFLEHGISPIIANLAVLKAESSLYRRTRRLNGPERRICWRIPALPSC